MITETQIAKLEAAHGHRWTKDDYDRMYFDPRSLGLEVEYYNTGSVRSAAFDGKGISNAEARRIMASKLYIDVKDGSVHTRFERIAGEIEESLRAKLDGIVADALA